jgi:uncharacterized protein YbjT (DUF2867 family)
MTILVIASTGTMGAQVLVHLKSCNPDVRALRRSPGRFAASPSNSPKGA